ncbi:acetyltransferase [Flavobacterium suncheonense]|nr:acetyltransferase [Flavobacterium suncheonense]
MHMYIFGASGQGKVIASILKVLKVAELKGFIDDNPPSDAVFGLPVVHASAMNAVENQSLIIGIGNNANRKKVAERLNAHYFSVVHPSAAVCESAVLGSGTVVMPNAVINADTTIGKHCIINSGAVVEHDCTVADYVHISPNAALAGNIEIGEGSHVGLGAVVLPGVKIGKWATIGAGTVVLKDVPDYAVVVGNPGRIIKYTNAE